MKVYGYDDTGPARGELLAAIVNARDADFGMDMLADALGWEKAFTSFRAAQLELLDEMDMDADPDPDLIRMVRKLKACYVPIVEDLT